MRPWDGIISDEEQRAYNVVGLGRPSAFFGTPLLGFSTVHCCA